jgi:UPF0755 protein
MPTKKSLPKPKPKKSPVKSKGGFWRKFWISLALILALFIGGGGVLTYLNLFKSNVYLGEKKEEYIFIKTGSTLDDVVQYLVGNGLVLNGNTFKFFAELRNYEGSNIKPGRYKVFSGMGNFELINLLRSGKQEPVKVVLTNARTKEQLAGIISRKIEADSLSLLDIFNNSEFLYPFGFSPENVIGMFLPNTYEFYWNTSASQFFAKMEPEYRKFWTESRIRKAQQMNLTQGEVATLASIVEKETNYNPEKKIIAGVYLNRIKKGMPLQADPTVVFAVSDFSIKRITSEHTSVNSPYNTYKNLGLPPGPICMPGKSSLDAVLNAETHNFIYFCAKEDFSGAHNFATNFDEHQKNARKYQKALNARAIH